MECICLISLPQQENIKQPRGGIESWQLNFPSLFIIQWQSFKMTPGTQKINYHVIFHAVVVHSVLARAEYKHCWMLSKRNVSSYTDFTGKELQGGQALCVPLL